MNLITVKPPVPTTRMSVNKQVPQVSTPRELTGVEIQPPAYGKPHQQANEDEHDVPHNQVSRRDSNPETGLEAQNSTEEKPHNQARDGPDDVHNQVHDKYSQVLGVELQSPTTKGLHNLVPGVESQTSTVQGSGSGESRDQPPCCLTHSYKSNIVFTRRLLLRDLSWSLLECLSNNLSMLSWSLLSWSLLEFLSNKSDKKFKKTARVLEVMNWWRAVFELSVLTTAFHVSMGLGFHYNSTRKLQQQTGFHNNSPKEFEVSTDLFGTESPTTSWRRDQEGHL